MVYLFLGVPPTENNSEYKYQINIGQYGNLIEKSDNDNFIASQDDRFILTIEKFSNFPDTPRYTKALRIYDLGKYNYEIGDSMNKIQELIYQKILDYDPELIFSLNNNKDNSWDVRDKSNGNIILNIDFEKGEFCDPATGECVVSE
jgi:hypothetical protein